jgi:copper chaperone
MTKTTEHTVHGMTCSHCALSVHEEVAEVAGVTAVAVDLGSGRLTVTGSSIDARSVHAAVAEAGYEVAA